jgi:outer membrane immunogenic protein
MKKLAMATAALAFAAVGTAGAADLPLKAPPPPPPVASWTGCYISGGVGYGMWNQDHSNTNDLFVPPTTVTTTDGGRGWLGRGGVGCDYQIGSSFLIGAFGDYDWMGLNGTNETQLISAGSPTMFNVKETAAWYAGARIGYLPYQNLMTFISGGWTGTRFTNSGEFLTATGVPIAFTFPGSYTVGGWFIGGGYEYKLPWATGLYWKTEYRFANYRQVSLAETTLTGVLTGNVQNNQSFVQTATTSLVWRFNWGGPVVAKY